MTDAMIIQMAKELKEKGISFKKQAERIGINESTYNKILHGVRTLPEKYRAAAEDYFNMGWKL